MTTNRWYLPDGTKSQTYNIEISEDQVKFWVKGTAAGGPYAGDVIAIAGLPDIEVGETICAEGKEEALPKLRIDEPTLQMTFGTNSSPFIGKEGKIVTYLDANSNKDLDRYQDSKKFEEWINKYIYTEGLN